MIKNKSTAGCLQHEQIPQHNTIQPNPIHLNIDKLKCWYKHSLAFCCLYSDVANTIHK